MDFCSTDLYLCVHINLPAWNALASPQTLKSGCVVLHFVLLFQNYFGQYSPFPYIYENFRISFQHLQNVCWELIGMKLNFLIKLGKPDILIILHLSFVQFSFISFRNVLQSLVYVTCMYFVNLLPSIYILNNIVHLILFSILCC